LETACLRSGSIDLAHVLGGDLAEAPVLETAIIAAYPLDTVAIESTVAGRVIDRQ